MEHDVELIAAIDRYLARLRERMIARVDKGEAVYHGVWKRKSAGDLIKELSEEEDDAHVYRAMLENKL